MRRGAGSVGQTLTRAIERVNAVRTDTMAGRKCIHSTLHCELRRMQRAKTRLRNVSFIVVKRIVEWWRLGRKRRPLKFDFNSATRKIKGCEGGRENPSSQRERMKIFGEIEKGKINAWAKHWLTQNLDKGDVTLKWRKHNKTASCVISSWQTGRFLFSFLFWAEPWL